jgi:hypothetical protein
VSVGNRQRRVDERRTKTRPESILRLIRALPGAGVTSRLHRAPELVLSDRVQHLYPKMVNGVVERMFRIDNPLPKPRVHSILREERDRAGIRWRDMVRDSVAMARAFL